MIGSRRNHEINPESRSFREALIAALKLNAYRILQHLFKGFFHKESKVGSPSHDVMCITYKMKEVRFYLHTAFDIRD